jgi:hypothetical protein
MSHIGGNIMFNWIKVKFAPKKVANESTPLILSCSKYTASQEEFLLGMIQDVKDMLSVMLKFEKLNIPLDWHNSEKTERLIENCVNITQNWKNEEFEALVSRIQETFERVKYRSKYSHKTFR